MKHAHTVRAAAVIATALTIPIFGATAAVADTGKSSIYDCTNRTINSTRTSMSVTCNTRGTSYYFQVACSWYSAGKGGTYWQSSPWTTDNRAATATCKPGSWVTAVGSTVYWRS